MATLLDSNSSSNYASFSGGTDNIENTATHDFQNFQQINVGLGPSTASNGLQQPFYMKPAFRFKTVTTGRQEDLMQDGPGRRLRKNVANVRKHIDYIANVLNHVEGRLWQHSRRDRRALQPDVLYQQLVLPAASTPDVPVDCVLSKFVRSATNKVKCPVYALCWTPEGKRLVTGASSGEFTLWNGTAFNFETILQAHDVAVRALRWSHNDQWMASADHDGFVKYWQPNMNNVHMFHAHKDEPIRSLSFSPTDIKLVTGSDDATARIWDFARCAEERVLRGHGADVRSVDWHPTKGLIATGSRDSQQPVKLWDPKTGQCLSTLHDHKNSVMSVQWNRNGNWLLTGSRDHLIKLYDIRMMKEMQTFRGHKKEVTALAWHPVHEGLFVSGGGDGSLGYWLVNTEKEMALLEQAHDQAVWTLDWHPLGHILATGSNDNNTKFWTRNRPGDTQEDVFGLAALPGAGGLLTTVAAACSSGAFEKADTALDDSIRNEDGVNTAVIPVIPGMGLDEEIYGEINRDVPTIPTLPGLGGMFDESMKSQIGAKKTLIKQPPPKRAQRQFERMWMVSRPGGGNEVENGIEFEEGNFFNIPSIGPTGHATANGGVTNVGGTPAPRQPKGSLLGAPPPVTVSSTVNPSLLAKPKSMLSQPTAAVATGANASAIGGSGIGQGELDEGVGIAEIAPMKAPMALKPPPPTISAPSSDSWLTSGPGAPPRKLWKPNAPQQQLQPQQPPPHFHHHQTRAPSLLNQNIRPPPSLMMPPGSGGFIPPGGGPSSVGPPHQQQTAPGGGMPPPRPLPPAMWGEDWHRDRRLQNFQSSQFQGGGKHPPNQQQQQYRRKNMRKLKPYNS